ncbi:MULTISPECIES: hypothetical protein [unclassified Rhizobium]|uniref:hypothetical protein n=1 Tax=unclassified Rhizobium TaxID=2613769 RepID=UPI0011464B40|nr:MULTISPECIES: hypothetical protein [unclassified Rhizobium]MDM9623266.1 hypothetical protein [Rhizobium sp. S96]
MKTDLGLRRDQRRLALMKLSSLSEDHPLREKYRAWIAQLDSQLSGLGAPLGLELPEALGVLDKRKRHNSPSITTRHGAAKNGGSRPGGASMIETSQRARLLSENQLLRGMLARFG